MKSHTIVTAFVLIALSIAAFGILYIAGSSVVPTVAGDLSNAPQHSELVGNSAPYFDLPNLSGEHVKLSQFADKPVVLVFWSTWNSQASDQMKILDDYLAGNDSAQFVEFLAINSQEETSIVSSFMRRGGYRVPVLLDSYGSVTQDYKIKAVPTFVFIDKSGAIREVYAGILSGKEIGDKTENLLR